MLNSSVKKTIKLGEIPGNFLAKPIEIYEVKLSNETRIMFNFYQFIDNTTGYEGEPATYTKVWRKIPFHHKLSNDSRYHDRYALIDYVATAMITFDSKRRNAMQTWWVSVLDQYLLALLPKQFNPPDNNEMIDLTGCVRLAGFDPNEILGTKDTRSKEEIIAIKHRLREVIQGCTISFKGKVGRLGLEGLGVKIFYVWNDLLEHTLKIECEKILEERNARSNVKGSDT